jgi:hypothetical protein
MIASMYGLLVLERKNPCGTLAKYEKLKNQIVSSLWMDICNVG